LKIDYARTCTIPISSIVADSATATGLKWAAAAGGGKVLQVVSATTTTETSINTTSLTDTTITATITPTLATSKILVLVSFSASVNKLNVEVYTGGKLLRGATTISDFGSGNMLGITADAPTIAFTRSKTQGSITKLDDPATTSATTYKVQMRGADAGAEITMQQGSSPSTITLLEIGA
jgi:hypothetical protein